MVAWVTDLGLRRWCPWEAVGQPGAHPSAQGSELRSTLSWTQSPRLRLAQRCLLPQGALLESPSVLFMRPQYSSWCCTAAGGPQLPSSWVIPEVQAEDRVVWGGVLGERLREWLEMGEGRKMLAWKWREQ